MTITLAELRSICKTLEACAEPKKTVETALQAKYMTLNDPFGHKWRVGDKYYTLPAQPPRTGNVVT